jgi:hypothetical protein
MVVMCGHGTGRGHAEGEAPRRIRLAGHTTETTTDVVGFGLLTPMTLAMALSGEGLWIGAIDIALLLAALVASVWYLRRRLRLRIAVAPEMPEGARLDGRGPTVLRELGLFVPLALLLALDASEAGALYPLLTVGAALVLGWYALRLRRWERRNGRRIYRERRFWAWDAPFFFLQPPGPSR